MSAPSLPELSGSPLHVLHIGAGTGRDLARYLEAGARAVTLVEADAEAIPALQALAAERDNVHIVEAAVSGTPAPRPFRRMNFADLSAFRAPSPALKALFPGLRSLSEDVLAPVDPVALLHGLNLPAEGELLLVLETPGETLGILHALKAADLLARVDGIRLQEGREPLYEGAPTAGEIANFLTSEGFSAKFDPDSEDPDRPHLIARIDRAAAALRTELESARGEASAAQEALATERDSAATLRTELDNALSEAKAAQEALATERNNAATLRTELEGARGEVKAAQEALVAERDSAATLRTELDNARGEAKAAQGAAETRLLRSREEMLKAEGQIRLIRDLLLSRPGL